MVLSSDKRVSRRLEADVGPDATETTTFEVKHDATIEQVEIRFYRGPQLDVTVRPFVESPDGERRRDIVTVAGNDGITGDNDSLLFHVSEPVEKGERVGFEVSNSDSTWVYDVNGTITLERAGGLSRAILGRLGVL